MSSWVEVLDVPTVQFGCFFVVSGRVRLKLVFARWEDDSSGVVVSEEWYAIGGELVDGLVCLCRVRRLELSVCDGFEVAGCWGNNCQVIRVWLPKGERTTFAGSE